MFPYRFLVNPFRTTGIGNNANFKRRYTRLTAQHNTARLGHNKALKITVAARKLRTEEALDSGDRRSRADKLRERRYGRRVTDSVLFCLLRSTRFYRRRRCFYYYYFFFRRHIFVRRYILRRSTHRFTLFPGRSSGVFFFFTRRSPKSFFVRYFPIEIVS